jgi:hypothetical protein
MNSMETGHLLETNNIFAKVKKRYLTANNFNTKLCANVPCRELICPTQTGKVMGQKDRELI